MKADLRILRLGTNCLLGSRNGGGSGGEDERD
jgi:hypothetical protein